MTASIGGRNLPKKYFPASSSNTVITVLTTPPVSSASEASPVAVGAIVVVFSYVLVAPLTVESQVEESVLSEVIVSVFSVDFIDAMVVGVAALVSVAKEAAFVDTTCLVVSRPSTPVSTTSTVVSTASNSLTNVSTPSEMTTFTVSIS